jgi:hypothetical protein
MISIDYAAFRGLAARDRGRLYVTYDLISRAPADHSTGGSACTERRSARAP